MSRAQEAAIMINATAPHTAHLRAYLDHLAALPLTVERILASLREG
jgi:hypothetical protein